MRVAVALLVLATLVALAPAAAAHANYLSSDPARGARLTAPPSTVTVTLSEEIDPDGSQLEVVDAQGNRVDQGPVRIQTGSTPVLSVDLRDDLGPGAYKVLWKALSGVDGHITSGSFGFAVGAFEPPAEEATPTDYDVPSAASRTLGYVGFALAFGALAFWIYVEPAPSLPKRATIVRRALLLGTLLVLLGILFLTALTIAKVGLGAQGFFSTRVGKEFAFRVGAAAVAFVAALVVARRAPTRAAVVVGVPLLATAVGNSLFAHSATEGWWAVAVDLVHLVAVAVWLGGLGLFLHFALQASRAGAFDDVLRVGRRFSRLALVAAILLGASGVISSLVIVGWGLLLSPLQLIESPYGAFLAGKILLFGAMIGLAAVNRFVFLGGREGPGPGTEERPAPPAPDAPRRRTVRTRRFTHVVAAEAALGLLVLVLAGFLTAISPPSPVAGSSGDALMRTGYGSYYNATLVFRPPPAAGDESNLTVLIQDGQTGAPLTQAVRVRVTIASDADNATDAESWVAVPDGNGRWIVGDVLFPQAGPHRAQVEIQTEDVYRDIVTIPFPVAAP